MEVQGSSALWDVFHPRTGGLGDRVAVSAPGVELTFAELWKEADRLASGFAGAGLREGAVAGLMLPNSPLFPAALLALWRLDAAVALLSPQYGPGELDAIVEGIEPACIVRDVAATPELRPDARPNEPGAALLKFSSGSTAEPKGIALSAANVLAEVENVTGTLGLREGDRVLAGVPLFHSYGFDLGVLTTLFAGSTLVLEDAFVPRRTLGALSGAGVSAFLGVPAQYREPLLRSASRSAAIERASGLISMTLSSRGPLRSMFATRSR